MTSRDRMLMVISRGQLDHVPLCFRWAKIGGMGKEYGESYEPRWRLWSDPKYRMQALMEMGLDETVTLGPPSGAHGMHSGSVSVHCKVESRLDERHPLLVKEYDTPAGTLRQIVRKTEDWKGGDDVALFDDLAIPGARSIRYAVETADDVEVLIGGAPITQAYADQIGTDGYAPDASAAVRQVRDLLALV